MILLIGSEGSQGKRYQSILKYLGKQFICKDWRLPSRIDEKTIEKNVTGIIIATPTITHMNLLEKYLLLKKPIFVEKPISKNITEVRELERLIKATKGDVRMAFQYKYVVTNIKSQGYSEYDYFRHGNDGLVWDCLQIIGLARGMIGLKEQSPIWKCTINGEKLRAGELMDAAYVMDIASWLNGEKQDFKEVLDVHEKVHVFEDQLALGFKRD